MWELSKWFVHVIVIALAMCAISHLAKAELVREASARCQDLIVVDFSTVQDAPMQVTQAEPIAAEGTVPSYCRVQGYVSPQVGFELRLPLSKWNGKFIEVGCGGWCGSLWTGACDMPLRRGYACLVSDMGHRSSVIGGPWAYNNVEAEIDFAFRATHVAKLAGSAITERFFSTPPTKSYFMGCSQGGRQGLLAAQRFPWDFDGIIAGGPPIEMSPLIMNTLVTYLDAQGGGSEPQLSSAAVRLMHESVLRKCDLDDGVKDGVVGDPPSCKFTPSDLLCRDGQKTQCLTVTQAEVASKIYAGAKTKNGDKIYVSGPAIGSELSWIPSFIDQKSSKYMKDTRLAHFRYHAFIPDPGPGWNLSDLDVDRDYKRLGMMEALYSANNPDLRKFKAAGGKLIMYVGWNDDRTLPSAIIDYYETVERTMGGRIPTQEFLRLFVLPGVNHCSGGAGADAVDFLGHLESWVEKDQAPDELLSARLRESADTFAYPYRHLPATADNVIFTRPLYPYPKRAVYKGIGDPKESRNFQAVAK